MEDTYLKIQKLWTTIWLSGLPQPLREARYLWNPRNKSAWPQGIFCLTTLPLWLLKWGAECAGINWDKGFCVNRSHYTTRNIFYLWPILHAKLNSSCYWTTRKFCALASLAYFRLQMSLRPPCLCFSVFLIKFFSSAHLLTSCLSKACLKHYFFSTASFSHFSFPISNFSKCEWPQKQNLWQWLGHW